MGPMPFCIGEPVGIHYKGFAVVLGDHVEDDAGDDEQEAYDDEHDGTDQRGEVDDHAGAYEFGGDPSTQHDADDADDQAEGAEERQRLVFADHAEDGAHHFDAVANGIKFADGTFRAITVLNRHLIKTEIVVQRMNSHFGFDLKTTGQHWVGLYKSEGERSVASHDIGYVSSEQSIDGSTYEPIAEVVEWALVLLEVRGAQAVSNHHVIAFKNLVDHGWCRVSRVRIVAIRHDVHVSVDIFEHGWMTLPLP